MIALLGLAACQPAPTPTTAVGCPSEQLAADQVFVGESPCSAALLSSGEGRRLSDTFIANSRFRGVIRAPQSSLTALGAGGGTLIDFSLWDYRDRVHEVIPIVDDGWLDVDRFEIEGNSIVVGGTIVSLPDRPTASAGERREVAWRVEPDDPWLYVDGADGLYIHGEGSLQPMLDGQLLGGVAYGHDGTGVEDLGSALRVDGATKLTTALPSEALPRLFEQGRSISVEADGADEVRLYAGEELAWRVPVDEVPMELYVPDGVDGVAAFASRNGGGPRTSIGDDVSLELGEPGDLRVQLEPRMPARIAWTDELGNTGTAWTVDGDITLHRGAGTFDLEIDVGPVSELWRGSVLVPVGTSRTVSVPLDPIDTSEHILVRPTSPADRSRDWRGTDERALYDAYTRGATFTILAPRDDVAPSPPPPDDVEQGTADPAGPAGLHWRSGSLASSPWGDVLVWPYSPSPRQNAHGAPSARANPAQTLAAIQRGSQRQTAVPLSFLEALGKPVWMVEPRPELVMLQHPGDDPSAEWQAWWPWLDAGRPVMPLGPATWARVPQGGPLAAADAEQALLRGRVSAGTGPLVRVTMDDTPAGEIMPNAEMLRVSVESSVPVDRYAVITGGGRVARTGAIDALPWSDGGWVDVERWMVFVVWADAGPDWAVSGPVWLTDPGG